MGVSGNSVAGKSYQIFTVSEELLAKVVEAVQAGEKEARSSGNIQSFEVFCHGFRANISLGRIMVIPPAVCNDKKNFPTALLHGCLVRIFGTGGEEIGDLIEKKIGESEFDEYSQADFDTLKKELFTDVRDGKEACIVLFAPNWHNSREYIGFHFSKDSEQLKNDLRHQVFSAYYNPAVSSAFNALMTNVDTTKVDVTDITPKLTYPFLTENPLKAFPQLEKQAGYKKATVLLNRKTADEIAKQTLEPQELDVFDSLNQALENSLLPDADGAQGEGGYKAPTAEPGVPREASAKTASYESACGRSYEDEGDRDRHEGQCEKCIDINHGQEPSDTPWKDREASAADKEIDPKKAPKKPAEKSEAFGGKQAPPFGSKEKEACAPHETPFTNVGPGTEAHKEQEASAPAMKESVKGDEGKADELAGSPIGIAIDEQGVPRRKEEEKKAAFGDKWAASKTASSASNQSNRKHDSAHPETYRVDPTRLSSAYSAAYNGGFVDKHAMPPQKVRDYMNSHMGNNNDYAPHAVADHKKQIEAGAYGDDPLNRKANEKWGGAEVSKVKRGNHEIMADYIADVVAAEIDQPSEALSTKGKQARAKKESLLSKFRPKTAVELDIDSIWDAITEDMGPAPMVELDSDPNNPAPSNTEQREGFDETPEAPKGRPNKKDVQDLPEAFRSDEPEEKKEISEGEAEQQETDLENEATKSEEHHESSWRIDEKFADFVGEVADEIEEEEEIPEGYQRVSCDQCQMLRINGIPCHETGCPNMGARWDAEQQGWVKQRKCFDCGSTVDADDPCCSAPYEEEDENLAGDDAARRHGLPR